MNELDELTNVSNWDFQDGVDVFTGAVSVKDARRELAALRARVAELEEKNKNDSDMLAADGIVFNECFKLLGMDVSGAAITDIPAAIARLKERIAS